ncbi:MAG: serine/threonine-protein kinase, partial [Gemmataceae bacterium]
MAADGPPRPGDASVNPFADTMDGPVAAPSTAAAPDENAATRTAYGSTAAATMAAKITPPAIPGYEFVGEIGRGGMGVVYQAIQVRLHRTVAMKMILAGEYAGPDARIRFLAEAELAARMIHPNIVQLHEFNVHAGIPYFVLEYVDGGTLARKLDGEPLVPKEAAALIETLSRGVHVAHEAGIIHRDLKPGNILLQTRHPHHADSHVPSTSLSGSHRSLHGDASFGTLSCTLHNTLYIPKITDFGLAKGTVGESNLTVTGAIMGTPSYMAPEQAE